MIKADDIMSGKGNKSADNSGIKHHSHSSLSLLKDCEMAWYSRYVDKDPQIFGEPANFGIKTESILAKSMKVDFEEDERGKEIEETQEMTKAVSEYHKYERAWKSVDSYQKKIVLDPDKFDYMKKKFKVSDLITPKLEIIGYTDFTKGNIIMDLKTSKAKGAKPSWAEQMFLYLMAEEKTLGEIHQITRTKTPKVWFYDYNLTDDAARMILNNVSQRSMKAQQLESGELKPTCNPSWLCGFCSKAECPGREMNSIKPWEGK